MVSVLLISCLSIGSCFAKPTLIVILLLSAYSLYILYVRWQYKSLPNPPFKNFFIGNAEQLMLTKRNRHLLWIKWDKAYGPIFKICVFHKVIVMVTSSALAKTMCLNSNYPKSTNLYKPLQVLLGEPFMGKGLLTECNHGIWKIHRAVLNPAFHKGFLKKLFPIFDRHATRLVMKFNEIMKNKQSLSLLDYVNKITTDILFESVFSIESNCLEDDKNDFHESIYTALRAISESYNDPFFKYKPWNWGEVKRRRQAVRFLRNFGKEILLERLKNFNHNDETNRDIIGLVIRNSLKSNLSAEVLVDDFVTLFIAGQETTSNSLGFLFYLLANNFNVKKKAQEEVDKYFRAHSEIEYKNLKELTYIEMCWKEALRLYPPGYATLREITKGLEEVGGHILPIGTDVAINFIPIHYNNCTDEERFNPERLMNGNDKPYTNIPFSLGQRSCIGRYFAEFEAKTLIARILYSFDFKLCENQTFDIDEALTMRLSDGCQIELLPRT